MASKYTAACCGECRLHSSSDLGYVLPYHSGFALRFLCTYVLGVDVLLMLLGFELPNLGKLLVKYYLKYLNEAGMVKRAGACVPIPGSVGPG